LQDRAKFTQIGVFGLKKIPSGSTGARVEAKIKNGERISKPAMLIFGVTKFAKKIAFFRQMLKTALSLSKVFI
jgi:hypothetical protein